METTGHNFIKCYIVEQQETQIKLTHPLSDFTPLLCSPLQIFFPISHPILSLSPFLPNFLYSPHYQYISNHIFSLLKAVTLADVQKI